MKITKEVTAKSLLDRHWMKLSTEIPDIYEFLCATAEADGTLFIWPGMRYLTPEEEVAKAKAARP